MTISQIADTILSTCGNIGANCVPYKVSGGKPMHLPPICDLDFFDYLDPWGELAQEFGRRGARINIMQKYDIIVVNGKPEAINTTRYDWIDLLKPCGKLYVIFPSRHRGEHLAFFAKYGFVLIDERIVEDKLHITFRPPRRFDKPEWAGQQGCRVVLHSSGGFGDDIVFARYAPLVKKQASVAYLEARVELKPLFEKTLCYDGIIAKGDRWPEYDFHLPVEKLHDIYHSHPNTLPYLKLSKENRLGKEHIKIGYVYKGHHVKYGKVRQYDPAAIADILSSKKVKLYNFQKQSDYAATPEPLPECVTDLSPTINDWLDTARYMTEMDYFIAPDTAISHLAGAMGVPTYLPMKDEYLGTYYPRRQVRSEYYPDTSKAFWGADSLEQACKDLASKLVYM